MEVREADGFVHGYIFVPRCHENCCESQPQSFKRCQDSYPCSITKHDWIQPEPTSSKQLQTAYSSQDTGYRLIFPAIKPLEITRHNNKPKRHCRGVSLRDNYFGAPKNWKLGANCKGKRNRTIFTASQLERLEKEFHCQQYIVGSQRFYLAHDLGLNETQVKVWFQNRRIKWRRQYLESATASLRQAKIEQDADEEGCRKLDTST